MWCGSRASSRIGFKAVGRVGALAAARKADPFETALLLLTVGHKAAGMRMLHLTNDSALAIQRCDPRLLALL